MSDDLKERLQKHDWRHLTARIEQLEAQLAEEKARRALTIQQSDHFSAQLDTAADLAKDRNLQLADLQTQLAATREALQSAREYVSTDIDDGVPSKRKASRLLKRIDAALATAPATDDNHG